MSFEGELTLENFGTGFDAEKFIMGLLQEHLNSQVGNGKAGRKREEFDPAAMLEVLRRRAGEVEVLKEEAAMAVREGRERARTLGREHRECVKRLKEEAEDALQEVSKLEARVATVGSKAVSIGQRIDKVDKQRRRAGEAQQAIKIYDALRSEDEAVRTTAQLSLVPASPKDHTANWEDDDGPPDEAGYRATMEERTFLEAAGMLRKMDGMARTLKMEGNQRVVDGLAEANQSFETALLAEFDRAQEKWLAWENDEENEQEEGQHYDIETASRASSHAGIPEVVEEMRRCAASLFSFNGGGSCIQRYVSTLPFCIDENVMLRDEEGIARATYVGAATSEIDRVVDEIVALVEDQEEKTSKIFPAPERVMAAIVQRAFNQRLQRVVDACLNNVDDSCGVEAWMDAFVHAYSRVHKMVAEFVQQGRDFGDLDLDKLLQDVMASHRERFFEEAFASLSASLTQRLPSAITKSSNNMNKMLHREADPANAPPSPRTRMIALEQAVDAVERMIVDLLVVSRQVPEGPLDGAAVVLRAFQLLTDALNAHLASHLTAVGGECGAKLDLAVVTEVCVLVKVCVHAVMIVQGFAESTVTPVTRADVKATAQCTTMISDFCVWVEQQLGELLSLLVNAVSKSIALKLNQLQAKSDFIPKSDECGMEPTEACKQACALLAMIRDAWIEHGPPSLHKHDASKRALSMGLDGNTRALFGQLAEAACDVALDHMRHYHYSPVGGLQLMRDLGTWRALAATLHSPVIERRFEDCREAANVLVVAASNLATILETNTFVSKASTTSIDDLIALRSDWMTVKGRLPVNKIPAQHRPPTDGSFHAPGPVAGATRKSLEKPRAPSRF